MEFRYKDTSLTVEGRIQNIHKELAPYIENCKVVIQKGGYGAPEASLNLPDDEKILEQSLVIAHDKNRSGKLKHIFLVGIGGSNLGVKAFYNAYFYFRDLFDVKSETGIRMHFISTVRGALEDEIHKFISEDIIEKDEFLIIIISKSGATAETELNAHIVHGAFDKKFGKDITHERTIVITDENSRLWMKAGEKNITRLSIPKNVGGRYSIFSTVGILPLTLLQFDVKRILEATRTMRNECFSSESLAVISSAVTFENYKQGRNIHTMFLFGEEMESLGEWWRQIVGESLGKRNEIGTRVGITPTISIGSTDLHSVGQLYMGGPKDKFTTFVSMKENGSPSEKLLEAIILGSEKAYSDQQIPFVHFELSSAEDIASFMQLKMIEMMFLGKLLKVNPFDQPNVEKYKKETKKFLSSM